MYKRESLALVIMLLFASMQVLPPAAFGAVPCRTGAAELHYEQALKLEETGQVQAALKEYESALQAKPGSEMCQLGQARCFSALGLHVRALKILNSLTVSRPKDLVVWLNLAAVSLAAGEVEHSVQAIEQALTIDPNSPAATRMLAEISFRTGQYVTAASLSSRLIDLAPQNRAGYILLARCCRKLKLLPENMASVVEAAKDNLPHDADLFATLGKSARGAEAAFDEKDALLPVRQAWLQLSEKCYSYAVQAAPRDLQNRLELTRILKRSNKIGQAQQHLAEARKLAPNDVHVKALSESLKPRKNDLAARFKSWVRSGQQLDGSNRAN